MVKEEPPSREKLGQERHRESRTLQLNDRRAQENTVLIEASFEPTNGDDLWKKNGVFYGREAALQRALRKLRTGARTDALRKAEFQSTGVRRSPAS